MSGIIGTQKLTQVGIIVKDIEVSKQAFAKFLGVEVPDHFDGGRYEVTGTEVEGAPAPKANCLMAFFDVGDGVQIELIQPNGEKSTWQDFLDTHGEGIHHIAFNIKGMNKVVAACESEGMTVLQRGKYGSGDGEYVYMDATKDLKTVIELLESY